MNLGRYFTRGPSAVWISVIYAVVASLWILASDSILMLIIKDAERVSTLQTYKGLLFIAVTTVLFYFVIRTVAAHAKAEATAGLGPAEMARQPMSERHGSVLTEVLPPLIALAVLALAIAATGYFVFQYEKEAIKRDKQGEIATIADLKVNEIARWIAERRADASAFGRDSFLAAEVEDWLRRGAPSDDTGRRILARLMDFKTSDYRSVTLMDAQGQVRASTDGHPPVERAMRARAIESMHTQTAFLSNLYRADSGEVALELVGSLLVSEGGETRAVGALALRIDPRQYLFPLIESWPDYLRSGETLLVRREGDEVVFLNELRHRKDSALRLRLPVTERSLPAAMAVRGQEGVAEGRDYRGVPVLAALRKIPGSPWFMVAKVDTDEVYAQIRTLAWTVATLVAVFLATTGAAIALWWRQQRVLSLAQRYCLELEREALVRHFDYLAKYANDILLLIDERGRIVEVNERAVSTYGYKREELLQRNIRDLRAPETIAALEGQLARAAEPGGLLFETVHQRKDGTRFPAEVSARTITVEGRTFYQSIIRDITERKRAEQVLRESEQRFRDLADAMPQLVWTAEPDGRVDYYNKRYKEYVGIRRTADGSCEWSPVLHEDDVEPTVRVWQRALANGETYEIEHRVRRADGSFRWLLSRGLPVRDEQGRVIKWYGTATDIHELREAREALAQSHAELEHRVEQRTAELAAANRELEAFSYSVSHDLRAPLRHVMGFIKLLDQSAGPSLDEKSRHYVQTIAEAAQRMGHLIDDLLAFSRIGRAQMKDARVNLAQLVDEARQELAPETVGRHIDWRLEPLPQVRGDPALLRAVVVNLLSNAIKYTGNKDVARIEIGCQPQDGEVVCFVRDNGAGFDMRFADKLFGVFQRLHRAEEFEGTGIGLANVRRIIQRHGGRVWAEGEVNRGATFYFSLPGN